MKEFLKKMLRDFFTITAGCFLATTVYCSIFFPDVSFNIHAMWSTVLLGFVTTLPHFIFFSRKELGKKQMLARQTIHACVLLSILLTFAYTLGWIDTGSIVQPVVFILLVGLVYFTVGFLSFHHDKKIARELNEHLKQYKNHELQ